MRFGQLLTMSGGMEIQMATLPPSLSVLALVGCGGCVMIRGGNALCLV